MVEWYDFYTFGSLSTTIASKFYQTGTPLGDLIAWLATFAIGFLVRPFGALVFGRSGDLIGRKYTFLVTMTLMGLCTFAVGLLPTIGVIGPLAGVILITLRILIFAGLWYPMAVTIVCAIICYLFIRETKDVDISYAATSTAMMHEVAATAAAGGGQ